MVCCVRAGSDRLPEDSSRRIEVGPPRKDSLSSRILSRILLHSSTSIFELSNIGAPPGGPTPYYQIRSGAVRSAAGAVGRRARRQRRGPLPFRWRQWTGGFQPRAIRAARSPYSTSSA